MASEREPILVVTTNGQFARSLEKHLGDSGYAVATASDLASGVVEAQRNMPSLVLVDRQAISSIQQFLQNPLLRKVPIVSVQQPDTACSEDECLDDLEQGMDAVLCTRSYRELITRIRAILRRQQLISMSRLHYVIGNVEMDTERHEVTVHNNPVELTPKEFQILQLFLQNPSRAFSRQEILDRVWGKGHAVEEHTLDVHIHSLRHKIEADPADPQYIVTVRAVGYKLKAT